MLTTDQLGSITESAIVHEAIKLGVGVLKPLTDGERYDLIFDLRPELVRVQCKSAVLRGSILQVPCYSARRCRDGFLKRSYSASEIDALAAYNRELERSSSFRSTISAVAHLSSFASSLAATTRSSA